MNYVAECGGLNPELIDIDVQLHKCEGILNGDIYAKYSYNNKYFCEHCYRKYYKNKIFINDVVKIDDGYYDVSHDLIVNGRLPYTKYDDHIILFNKRYNKKDKNTIIKEKLNNYTWKYNTYFFRQNPFVLI